MIVKLLVLTSETQGRNPDSTGPLSKKWKPVNKTFL